MGGSNVAAVFAMWSPILGDKHRDMRALVFMANTALDGDKPPRYFGGWEALAGALGFDVETNPVSAERNTKKALSALTKAGAIVSSGAARAGVRAEYALQLLPGVRYRPSGSGRSVRWVPVDNRNEGDRQGYPGVTTTGTQRVTVRGTQQGDRQGEGSGTVRGTPRRSQEPHGGTREEPGEEPALNSQRNPSTRTRERETPTSRPATPPTSQPANDLIDQDTPKSHEDEVNRQAAALRRMAADKSWNWDNTTDDAA